MHEVWHWQGWGWYGVQLDFGQLHFWKVSNHGPYPDGKKRDEMNRDARLAGLGNLRFYGAKPEAAEFRTIYDLTVPRKPEVVPTLAEIFAAAQKEQDARNNEQKED